MIGQHPRFQRIPKTVLAVVVAVATLLSGQVLFGASDAHAAASGCVANIYRQGGNGNCVKYIQEIVNASKATTKISADGQFGPATKKAIVAFQKSRGISADGVVGKNTWQNLCAVTQSAASSPKSKSNCGSIRGWTRVFTNKNLNISACNTGTYNRLRFELGSSKTSVAQAAVGGLAIVTDLHSGHSSVVAKANWGNATWSVQYESPSAHWHYLGTVSLKRANYAPC